MKILFGEWFHTKMKTCVCKIPNFSVEITLFGVKISFPIYFSDDNEQKSMLKHNTKNIYTIQQWIRSFQFPMPVSLMLDLQLEV